MAIRHLRALGVIAALALTGCDGKLLAGADAECGSEDARKLVDELVKEELEAKVQGGLDGEFPLGSYDVTALANVVKRIKLSLEDVRTSRDDPDSSRLSCRAAAVIDLPDELERTVNEVGAMAEMPNVSALSNQYKIKRRSGTYVSEFDYFVQPTDDGSKLYAETDTDSATFSFLGQVIVTYLLADKIREAKIAKDREAAEAQRLELEAKRAEEEMQRESEAAFEAEGAAALSAAEVERKLASDRIGAVWRAMPREAQTDLEALHNAWVKQMKARCAAEAAGSDVRETMRRATELNCQTRLVRSCAATLARNTASSTDWTYCRL